MKRRPIYVTRPALPPLDELRPYLEQIWSRGVLTNGGPLHEDLEQALCEHLGVRHVSLFANGTIALMTALQALGVRGEVITTPYSFVATAHALLWNSLEPVFVDIDPATMNIDPARIADAITERTSAILPVHCYGTPCDVESIAALARRRGLKVIYDAAHAFGVKTDGRSVLNHGDLSILSFHATKVFNTFEGGAIVSPDAKMKERIDQLKNFGFVDEVTVAESGINGKMSEFNAAVGLLQLRNVDAMIARRKQIDGRYRKTLSEIKGIRCLPIGRDVTANYGYFPILVGADYPISRDALCARLRDEDIYARRYFFPLISDFPMYRGLASARHENLPHARRIAQDVLCLPIYPDLRDDELERIIGIIASPCSRSPAP